MKVRPRRSLLVTTLATIAVVAASCGGSSSAKGSAARRVHSCPRSAKLGPHANDAGVAAANGAAIDTVAEDSFFFPTCITGAPPGAVTVTVANHGASLHNISIPDQGIDRDIDPGETVTVNATVATAPLSYYCKYHRGSGMVGALIPAR